MRKFWLVAIFLASGLVLLPLCLLRFTWAAITGNEDRQWEILQGMDRLGNAVGNGNSAEFISTRANRAMKEKKRWGCVLCKLLDKVDPGHCARSLETREFEPAIIAGQDSS